jgi:two-component system cell cycle response regulator
VSNTRNSGTLILSRPVNVPTQEGPRGEACIILLHPPGPEIGKRTPLIQQRYIVGRDTDVDLVISRSSVSRQHSQLVQDGDGQWFVEDLGSTNGTFVNEERVTRRRLTDGDQVRFGDAIFKFLNSSNIESAYHEEIYRMTILDGLTGVHNKRYFLEFLERELASAQRHRHALSLVMFDIDHFKKVNDQRGHLAGDAVLKDLCGRLKPRIRREDLLARYGGEEFAAVLNCTSLEGAVFFAEHVRHLIAERPCMFDNEPIEFTVSLGVACYQGEEPVDVAALIRRADENLYAAKHGGRNRAVPSLADLGLV